MFCDYDADVVNEIYESQDRDFEKTIEIIESNAGKSVITMADILKKRDKLIHEVKKETTYLSLKNYSMVN